jgi:hypothetical protein
MRRLPDEQRADCLLASGALTGEIVEAVADRRGPLSGRARARTEP